MDKMDLVDAARRRLTDEFDQEKIVHMLRVSRLVSLMKLNRMQRLSVDFFRRYTIQKKDIDQSRHHTRGHSVDSIVRGLNPEENRIDRRILYELAGVKLDKDDYNDESSFSEDPNEAYTDSDILN